MKVEVKEELKEQSKRTLKNKDNFIGDIKKTKISKSNDNLMRLIPTNITLLDCLLGGGLPVGQIVNIIGDSSTGKSFIACEIIAQLRKSLSDDLVWFYDDVENRFNFNTKRLFGFDVIRKNQENSYTIEDFSKNLKFELDDLKKDKILVYVLDSFDSLTSDAEVKRDDKEQDKGTYGLEKVKSFGQCLRLRKKDIKDKNCILIIISQVRENINAMFGAKYYRTGGKALDHLSSVILWLAEVERLSKKKLVYGISTKIKATKTSNDKPFRECVLDIIFDYGIDIVMSNILYLYDLRTERGARKEKINNFEFTWNDKTFDNLIDFLKFIEDNNLEDELAEKVKEQWDGVENAVSYEGRKKKFVR